MIQGELIIYWYRLSQELLRSPHLHSTPSFWFWFRKMWPCVCTFTSQARNNYLWQIWHLSEVATEVTIMLLCRCERKDSSKAALSCCSPPASPGVEGEIYLWHFSTLLCNYVTEVATNVYPFRPPPTSWPPRPSLSSDTMTLLALWLCLAVPCHKDLQ